ncbi:MAG: homocysteine S-methyltransferase family protein [Gammaproteobacteria bacterium]|nr:homocysteine S-methyltransferase family protein [Gammaproteobacteria bacterium]
MSANKTAATGPPWLDERIRRGDVILIDGATGTELERRGVPMHGQVWCAVATLSHPEVLRAVHEDYIRAGAEVIIANTFASARHALEPSGLGDQVAAANRNAVALALAARDCAATGPVCIAGSISDFTARNLDRSWLEPKRLRQTFDEQAGLLADAGAELIALEMMQKPEIAVPAVEAAIATGLPVWIGISCRLHRDSGRLTLYDYGDRDLGELLEAVSDLGAGAFTVMHSKVDDTGAGIRAVREFWSGPLGAYPNAGHFVMPHWQFVDITPPEEFLKRAREWVDLGAQLIGGCCGLGVEHIAALRDGLPRAISAEKI